MASSGPNWNVMSGSPVTYTLGIDSGGKPEKTPAGLITTRAVETKDGWVGQVIVDKEIVYETALYMHSEENPDELAMIEVNAYVVERIKGLFAPSAP